jgi:hypothetical protein
VKEEGGIGGSEEGIVGTIPSSLPPLSFFVFFEPWARDLDLSKKM